MRPRFLPNPSSPLSAGPLASTLLVGAAALLAAAWLLVAPSSADAASVSCMAESGGTAATLVELYTSEGYSSCPPADRWVGTLRDRPGVVALGFHVDYWDGQGWADRFASPANTHRQSDSQRSSGAHFSYTPQVLVDGRDWREWPSLPTLARPATVALRVERAGEDALRVTVSPRAGAPAHLAAEVAAVDDGLVSHVRAGENQGATLRHDDVVRGIVAVPAWTTDNTARTSEVRVPAPRPEAGSTRHWAVVVRDADRGTPLQALELHCER